MFTHRLCNTGFCQEIMHSKVLEDKETNFYWILQKATVAIKLKENESNLRELAIQRHIFRQHYGHFCSGGI